MEPHNEFTLIKLKHAVPHMDRKDIEEAVVNLVETQIQMQKYFTQILGHKWGFVEIPKEEQQRQKQQQLTVYKQKIQQLEVENQALRDKLAKR